MNTKPITLRLTLTVTFLPNGESVKALRSRMIAIAETAANRGQMTGDGPAEVEDWSSDVEDVTEEVEAAKPRTLHQLMKNGLFYRTGNWCEGSGELFDLTNDGEKGVARYLAESHGAALVAVENCVRE